MQQNYICNKCGKKRYVKLARPCLQKFVIIPTDNTIRNNGLCHNPLITSQAVT